MLREGRAEGRAKRPAHAACLAATVTGPVARCASDARPVARPLDRPLDRAGDTGRPGICRPHDAHRQALGPPARGRALRDLFALGVGRTHAAHVRLRRPSMSQLRRKAPPHRHHHRPCHRPKDPPPPRRARRPPPSRAGKRSNRPDRFRLRRRLGVAHDRSTTLATRRDAPSCVRMRLHHERKCSESAAPAHDRPGPGLHGPPRASLPWAMALGCPMLQSDFDSRLAVIPMRVHPYRTVGQVLG